jgi:hypothetical protein
MRFDGSISIMRSGRTGRSVIIEYEFPLFYLGEFVVTEGHLLVLQFHFAYALNQNGPLHTVGDPVIPPFNFFALWAKPLPNGIWEVAQIVDNRYELPLGARYALIAHNQILRYMGMQIQWYIRKLLSITVFIFI